MRRRRPTNNSEPPPAGSSAYWNGGGSDAFDEGLDELEHLTGARLTATERYDLWDQTLKAHLPL